MSESQGGTKYDQGAADFERLSPVLWNTVGNLLAAAAQLDFGDRVLDACCGTGASAIPAAQFVGSEGLVDGVDLSPGLLQLAEDKSEALALTQLRFFEGDVTRWKADYSYDAVLSNYGVFCFPALHDGARRVADLLLQDGRLAVSTWAQGAHEPFTSLFWDACAAERPELQGTQSSVRAGIDRLNTPDKLSDWLTSLGLDRIVIQDVQLQVTLDADLAWAMVAGTSYRHHLPEDEAGRMRVRERFLEALGDNHVLDASSLVGVGYRP